MIQKPIGAIEESDLTALISNGVREGRTIEYKRDLPGNSDGDKKEFLGDASSFANTSGGDLIFGIDESEGLPSQVAGVQSPDNDAVIRRLESILASGLDPRIRYALKPVECADGRRVFVIRVERSWNGPHRVVFQGSDKFFGRNAAGKYPLDVNELRAAFNLSKTAVERIRAFRADRLIALSNNETPVPFSDDSKIVLHCLPIESFTGQRQYDVLPFKQNPLLLTPMASQSWDRRLNLDGIVAFAGVPSRSYTQLYRDGVIEAVLGGVLRSGKDDNLIPSIAYEKYVVDYLPKCFNVLQQLQASAPVAVALSFTGTKGLRMAVDSYGFDTGYPIQVDTLAIPESIVEDFAEPVGKILKPIFDRVWNACGYECSHNFDADGNWINRR
jgi:hypothetical protein